MGRFGNVASCSLKARPDLTYLDVLLVSLAYQFIVYVMVRLARRGFTLGELGLVAQGATALFMESVNLTTARISPIATPYIKTYRSATPLLIFQIALIPGAFLTGFFLSPILVISRNLAQKPSYRLRFPNQKTPFRKALAGGFYVGAALIVGGLVGPWTGWVIGPDMGRGSAILASIGNPWVWTVSWLMEGRRQWTRPAILAYWGLLASISLAGWSRQLARARKNGKRIVGVQTGANPVPTAVANGIAQSVTRPHIRVSSRDDISSLNPTASAAFTASQNAMSQSMTEFFDAADKHVPTLGLNARRKFFHALAVVMFIPGVALDVSQRLSTLYAC